MQVREAANIQTTATEFDGSCSVFAYGVPNSWPQRALQTKRSNHTTGFLSVPPRTALLPQIYVRQGHTATAADQC